MMARQGQWTVEAGRTLHFDGHPVIRVGREGDTRPVVADGAAHIIAELFDQNGVTPDSIYERHMGHPRRARSGVGETARSTRLPEHLYAAFDWIDAAGEWEEAMRAPTTYARAAAANARKHGERIGQSDLFEVIEWVRTTPSARRRR
jgi:hypothetical protein